MPIVNITTNVGKVDVKDKCAELFSADLAAILGKPLDSVCTTVQADQDMFFLGSSDPAILITIQTIKDFSDPKECNRVCVEAAKAIYRYISIPNERIRIVLTALAPEHVGCGVEKGTVWDIRQQKKHNV